MQQNIDSILDAAEQQEASDVFLQEDEVPRLKINEQIIVLGEEPMSLALLTAFWQACGANAQSDGDSDRDTGFVSRTHTRYRVSLHRTMGRLGAVLRRIKTKVPTLKALGAPEWLLTRWGAREHGLILITGPTGSGKSTTIASLLQWMNETLVRHIVTIEDPVEYQFTSKRCHFTQRQVGRDTTTFAMGLRSALRQAPDVIFVGEIRDYETALTALQASETGHLVLSTMHSEKVADTMERYLNLFPAEDEKHGVNLLANQLSGVLCQKLVQSADGGLHCWWNTSKMRVPCATGSPDESCRTSISISPADRILPPFHFCNRRSKPSKPRSSRKRLPWLQSAMNPNFVAP